MLLLSKQKLNTIVRFKVFLIFAFTLFILFSIDSKSQIGNANVKIINAFKVDSNVFEFGLEMTRLQSKWYRWANATFAFKFSDSTFLYDSNILKFEQVEDQDVTINYGNFLISPLPVNKYSIDCTVFKQFLYVNIIGPENFSDCVPVPTDEAKRIAKFRITRTDGGQFPDNPKDLVGLKIRWLEPTEYYNAIAYKTDNPIDSIGTDSYNKSEDNIDLTNPLDAKAIFDNDTAQKPGFNIRSFSANYVGTTNVKLEWETLSEVNCKGFKITRTSDFYGGLKADELVYNYVVGDYNKTSEDPKNKRLKGLGTSIKKNIYTFEDTAGVRNAYYYYKLEYYDYGDQRTVPSRGYVKLRVPNSTISHAQANPNPFERATQIEYTVDDDVYLTASVFDLNGKEVKSLFKDQLTNIGDHTYDLNMPQFASQGLYDLRFFAVPIKDKTVEASQASVRLTMYR
ncbi:MAG: hypothetical protein NTW25_08020 [Candidatus Kapabacteria bacterium]|nr:hypothetical protein [Candidatus Kapabacteria bacterium]